MTNSQFSYDVLLLIMLFFLGGWLCCRLMVKKVIIMISKSGFVRLNYKGQEIPVGAGVVIFLSMLVVYAVAFLCIPENVQNHALTMLWALSAFTLLGLMDDVWGSRKVTGLKGHLLSLWRGQLTTGGIKALAGIVMSLLLAVVSSDELIMVPLNAAILALSVNCINLMDLRPGRAAKFFLLLWLLLCIVAPLEPEVALLAGVAGALLGYLPFDLRARAMLGDTGANALGAALGLGAVWFLDTPYKIGYLIFLIIFHLFTEKYSLTTIIAKNRLLRFLDEMGRR